VIVLVKHFVGEFERNILCECSIEVHFASVLVKYLVRVF
jgi:hypothetical protein